ncbi:MAG: 6,7-dimethyl-8-ribityllumazine synthase [Phycisphaerae bacterium]|nr:MAG: 6,7-dimethyl-8-ribityllumazine synthase [Phycisphaerae bacterium]
MAQRISGEMSSAGFKFALVVSRFNDFITSKLVDGAIDTLVRHGTADDDISVLYVPGAFELPFMAKRAAASGAFDAVVCLGCVIRGQTPHFDYVAGQAARGIAQVGLDTGVPTTFGLITSDTLEQAIERAGSKAGNKGSDAAASAIELVSLLSKLSSST